MLVAAVCLACCVTAVAGRGDAFAIANNRVAFDPAVGFVLPGIGILAVAWDMTQPGLSEPTWVPIGAGIFATAIRVGLWQTFSVAIRLELRPR